MQVPGLLQAAKSRAEQGASVVQAAGERTFSVLEATPNFLPKAAKFGCTTIDDIEAAGQCLAPNHCTLHHCTSLFASPSTPCVHAELFWFSRRLMQMQMRTSHFLKSI
jgi:hypothetical protein